MVERTLSGSVWMEAEPVDVPQPLRSYLDAHPLVGEVLVRRGITTVEQAESYLDPDAYEPAPPEALPDVGVAVDRIERAIEGGEPICVWGDFDVDGQTATTVLVSTLQDLGAEVTYHIPIRDTESHGMQVPWLKEELDRGVALVVTCDTGIDAHEAVEYAHSRGVDVIITDHHELPEVLPEADAVINPHRLPDDHPLATLPGVGVAYKLVEALYAARGWEDRGADLLDLVALGIVADVASLQGDTRYLLQRGLAVLRRTSRLGLQTLMERAKVRPETFDVDDIGFGLAPRLNAVGRLADANVVVDLFTTEDLTRARILASQLESLNDRRRELCDDHFREAKQQVHDDPALLERAALVLSDPDWHPGVIGIVANRMAELYHRPAVMIAAPPGELARGSARSVPGCHITEALATQADLFEGFGGHAMAAGMALKPENISSLARGLSDAVARQLEEAEEVTPVEVDGRIPLSDLSLDLVADLDRLAPFGPDNPRPILMDADVRIAGQRKLGRDGAHLKLQVEDAQGHPLSVFWWGWRGAKVPDRPFDLAYRVRRNTFRGEVELQVEWVDARFRLPAARAARLEAVEVERVTPERVMRELDTENAVIWREGPRGEGPAGVDRFALEPAETLVIWSLPASVDQLCAVLEKVRPGSVWIVGEAPGTDEPGPFTRRLVGLLKYALAHKEGVVSIETLASAMAHREVTVRQALTWLEARGVVAWEEAWDGIHLSRDVAPDEAKARRLEGRLEESISETAHYRAYLSEDLSRLEAQITRILEKISKRG